MRTPSGKWFESQLRPWARWGTLGPHCQDQAIWKGSNHGEGGHAGGLAIAPSVVTPGLAPWTSGSPACLPRSQFPRCRP